MKVKVFLIAFLCTWALTLNAQKKIENLRYDIECTGKEASDGYYLVKVWVYTKESKLDSEMLKKYAVHGVIFKGYAGKDGCKGQKPMAQTPALEQEKKEFFYPFFNRDKAFAKYATEIDGSFERIKIGKEYKYGAIISVSKGQLRKDLEAAGVIRGLSSGF